MKQCAKRRSVIPIRIKRQGDLRWDGGELVRGAPLCFQGFGTVSVQFVEHGPVILVIVDHDFCVDRSTMGVWGVKPKDL